MPVPCSQTRNQNPLCGPHDRDERNSRKRGKRAGVLVRLRPRAFRPPLPTILLINVQSLDNKLCDVLWWCDNKRNLIWFCYTMFFVIIGPNLGQQRENGTNQKICRQFVRILRGGYFVQIRMTSLVQIYTIFAQSYIFYELPINFLYSLICMNDLQGSRFVYSSHNKLYRV